MSITHQADPAAPAGLIKSITDEEPVLAAAAATWLLASVGDILVTDHVITSTAWSGLDAAVASPLAGVILIALGWAVRHLVASPKTVRLLQRELDLAKSSSAATTIILTPPAAPAAPLSTDNYQLGMPTTAA